MVTLTTPAAMQSWALAQRAAGLRIGCVPTMGCLHAGHLALVDQARARTDCVVVSVFVNPTQFGPQEDFARYPRDPERDLQLCRERHVTAVFLPRAQDMYAADHSIYVVEERLGAGLCGASRPGHFRGVCTVVAQLFNLMLPHVAVFGQKDAQQAAIIRRLARDLHFPVEIVVAPIVREPDGLALSSRNLNLSAAERRQAGGLSQSLRLARELFDAGAGDAAALRATLATRLAETFNLRVDYVATVDSDTLEPVSELRRGTLLALAAWAGRIRLIDNTRLGEPEPGLP